MIDLIDQVVAQLLLFVLVGGYLFLALLGLYALMRRLAKKGQKLKNRATMRLFT